MMFFRDENQHAILGWMTGCGCKKCKENRMAAREALDVANIWKSFDEIEDALSGSSEEAATEPSPCQDCDKSCGRTGNLKKEPCPFFGDKGNATDFSDCEEHGCCECDKDCKLAEKKEAAKPTSCNPCTHQDTCAISALYRKVPCAYFQAKSKSQVCSGSPDQEEATKQTCADCANQNEGLGYDTGLGITLCTERKIHVPLSLPACGDFVQASKGESEQVDKEAGYVRREVSGFNGDDPGKIEMTDVMIGHVFDYVETFEGKLRTGDVVRYKGRKVGEKKPQSLQEKTKTIAETISDLYYQIANLDPQRDSVGSSKRERFGRKALDHEEFINHIQKMADTFMRKIETRAIEANKISSCLGLYERLKIEWDSDGILAQLQTVDQTGKVVNSGVRERVKIDSTLFLPFFNYSAVRHEVNDLRTENADLKSQKESLKSANKELKDLVLNCPACDSHVQEIDALVDENNKLCDTFLEQDVKLRKELLAEKSWRIGMNGKLENRDSLIDDLRNRIDLLVKGRERMLSEINAHCLASERESEIIANLQRRLHEQSKEIEAHCKIADELERKSEVFANLSNRKGDIISNLQKKLQAEVKENEILANSLSAAESALGVHEDTIDVLTKKNARLREACRKGDEIMDDLCDQLYRAEEEYMKLADAQSGTATAYRITRDTYRAKVKGN